MEYGEALSWLLEDDPQDPGVRYFALRQLLDKEESEPEVIAAQRAIMTNESTPNDSNEVVSATVPASKPSTEASSMTPKRRRLISSRFMQRGG